MDSQYGPEPIRRPTSRESKQLSPRYFLHRKPPGAKKRNMRWTASGPSKPAKEKQRAPSSGLAPIWIRGKLLMRHFTVQR